MKDYIRPQTLFNTKFDGYLQAAKRDGVYPRKEEPEDDIARDENGNPREY